MEFIGRTNERKMLKTLFDQESFASVLVYGRRRVGKSELIKKSIRESNIKYNFPNHQYYTKSLDIIMFVNVFSIYWCHFAFFF